MTNFQPADLPQKTSAQLREEFASRPDGYRLFATDAPLVRAALGDSVVIAHIGGADEGDPGAWEAFGVRFTTLGELRVLEKVLAAKIERNCAVGAFDHLISRSVVQLLLERGIIAPADYMQKLLEEIAGDPDAAQFISPEQHKEIHAFVEGRIDVTAGAAADAACDNGRRIAFLDTLTHEAPSGVGRE